MGGRGFARLCCQSRGSASIGLTGCRSNVFLRTLNHNVSCYEADTKDGGQREQGGTGGEWRWNEAGLAGVFDLAEEG